MSAPHTSRFVEPFLKWLIPGISQATVDLLHLLIRKAGHLTEYAILAMLLRHSIRAAPAFSNGCGYWRAMVVALLLAMTYAGVDELHQAFVPSRIGSVVDVLIDTGGAAIGLALLAGVDWLRTGRTPRTKPPVI